MGSESRQQEDDGDAGNRGEVASGERHGASNATIEPTGSARMGFRLFVCAAPLEDPGAAR